MAHTLLTEIFYSGGWHTVPTYNRDDVVIGRGRQNRLTRPSPSTLEVTINNRDGTYSPRNANSPLFGLIGRNTPIRQTIDGDVRFVGEVESWPQRWDRSGKDAWVPIVAFGISRRLGGAGTQAPKGSSLRRTWGASSAIGYWPLEDGAAASVGSSGLPGGTAATVTDPLFTTDGVPDGSAAVLEFTTTTAITAPINAAAFAGPGWALGWILRPPALTSTPTVLMEIDLQGHADDVVKFQLVVETGFVYIVGLDSAGSSVFSSKGGSAVLLDALYSSPDEAEWLAVAMYGSADDADLRIQITYSSDGFLSTGYTSTLSAGSSGAPTRWTVPAAAGVDGMGIGHVVVQDGPDNPYPAPSTPARAAFYGYAGETVEDRITRVGAEEGIPVTIVGDADQQLGPQPYDSVLGVLQHAADVDTGPLVESRDQLGLLLRSLDSIYDQSPALTLDYAAREVRDPQPSEDTHLVQNDVAVRNLTTGAFQREAQETGPLNVSEPADDPQGVGRYSAEVSLNLHEDAQAIQQAGWRVWLGTQDEPRFPSITVDFDLLAARGGSKTANAVALDLGDVLRIDNPPIWLGADHIDQVVQGYTETVSLSRRVLRAYTEPYRPYAVGVLGEDDPGDDTDPDLVGRWAGDEECAIRAAIDTTTTSITFDPNTFRWSSVSVHDTFTRTEASEWGTPDTGAAWTTAISTGGDPSVAGGLGIITLDTANAETIIEATGVSLADVQILARGLSPASTPSGDQASNGFYLRASADYSTTFAWCSVEWATDGTATLLIITSADGVLAATTVPGVASSAEVDLLILARGSRIHVWAVPSATGLDLSEAPLESVTTTVTSTGRVAGTAFADASLSVPLAMRFSEIGISSPGSFADDFPMQARLVSSPAAPTSGGELVTISQISTTPAAFVAAGAADHDNNLAVTPGDYAGGAVGDWVVVYAGERDTGGMTLAISDPNYTYDDMGQQDGLYVWAARRTADTPAPTVTPSGGASGDTVSAQVFGLRNMPITLSPSNYILDSAGLTNASAQNMAYPSLPAGEIPGRVILLIARKSDDWTSVAPPTGFLEVSETDTTSGDDQGLWIGYRFDEEPTRVANGSITVTGGGSAPSDTMLIALAGGHQTATVTRSVNGIEKSHAAGTRLEKETPLRWAL